MNAIVSPSGQIATSGDALAPPYDQRPTLSSDAIRIERVLATARLALSVASAVFVVAIAPIGPVPLFLIAGYVAFSAWIWHRLQSKASAPDRFPLVFQIVDLSAVALMMGASGGFHWTLFGLYLFLPTAAAYRWGLVAALATTAAVLCFLALHALASDGLMVAERVFYLGVSGALVGYIAGREKRTRDESATIAAICCGMKGERGMMGSLTSLFPKLREITGARAILLVAREPRYGRLFLWRLCDAPDTGLRSAELVPSEHDVYLFPMASEAWYMRRSAEDREPRVPQAFVDRHPFASLFAISLSFGPDWLARAFVLDPATDARQLPFLVRLLHQVGPALHTIYLQGRMHSRIGEMERARVARELHDQTVQSLIGLEMELAAWRRSAGEGGPALHERLSEFQSRIHEEVLTLRELMQQLRPVYTEPRKLLSYMSEIVDRFQRETGIAASFMTDVEEVDISQEVCGELVRILQESLVNVRKHSGARNVSVSFSGRDGRWSLVIDDDGRGFDFTGRRRVGGDEVCKGPSVIHERVQLLGGELILESDPARGARLEVVVPGSLNA